MILEAFLIAVLSSSAQAKGALPPLKGKNKQVSVQADQFQVAGKAREATFVGHVRAKRGPTLLTCDRLIAHYSEGEEITRIECIGHVEAHDGEKWAKGDRADFDNQTGILEVTGSPEAHQGPNHMVGTKVVFDVEKNTITVSNAKVDVVSPDEGLKVKSPKAPGAAPAPGGSKAAPASGTRSSK